MIVLCLSHKSSRLCYAAQIGLSKIPGVPPRAKQPHGDPDTCADAADACRNRDSNLIISDERLHRRGFAYDSSEKPVPKQVLTKSLCRKRTVVLHALPLVPGEHHIRIVSEKERQALLKDDT